MRTVKAYSERVFPRWHLQLRSSGQQSVRLFVFIFLEVLLEALGQRVEAFLELSFVGPGLGWIQDF